MALPLQKSVNLLDSLIVKLEDATGERGLRIKPDDPWARHHLQSLNANNTNVSVRACSNACGYLLTSPFESRCPLCAFKQNNFPEQFSLPPVEQILAALPKERPGFEEGSSKKPPSKKK